MADAITGIAALAGVVAGIGLVFFVGFVLMALIWDATRGPTL